MTRILLLLLAAFYIASCHDRSPVSREREQYLNEVRLFMQFVRGTVSDKDSIVLSDRAGGHIFNSCEDAVFRDSSFTTEEQQEIRSQLKHPLLQTWTTEWVSRARIIPQDSITTIFKSDLPTAWEAFYNRYGGSLTTFSAPIFLRHNTLCLFYSSNMCGGLCGEGRLSVYQKDGNKWKLLRALCDWVS